MSIRAALIASMLAVALASTASAQSVSGESVYQRRCAACHEKPADGRTPSVDTLKAMTATRILRTLDFGAMMTIAYQLRRDEREAVASFLGRPGGDAPPPASAFCRDRSVTLDVDSGPVWNGWSPTRDNARFAPASLAGLTAEQVPTLTLKWAFGFDGDISAFSQPTVIGNQVFIGSAGGVVHALRADTGCHNSACSTTPVGATCPEGNGPDYDFGSPALLVSTTGGRELLLAGQKSGVVWAFDPDKNGEVMWETRVGQGGINGGVQWGMASDGEYVYAAASDAVATRTATARILDPKVGGGLTALRIADGSTVWRAAPPPCTGRPNCSPAQSAALTAIPGVVFSGSLAGHLRAYSTRDGAVIWDVDTIRSYDTVNGVKASGGAIDGPGAVVSGGMVFVNSGYMRFGGAPGNVLLAFAPQ